jgi:hypothetical protein
VYTGASAMPGAPPAGSKPAATSSNKPASEPTTRKPAWQVKQEQKVAKSLAQKEARAGAGGDDDDSAAPAAAAAAASSSDAGGGGEGGGEGGGKQAWGAKKASPRKMKIGKNAVPKCGRCTKTVYENEKIEAIGKVWHNTCFNCVEYV